MPLNDIADAILQARLQDGKTSGGYFFVKPNGKPVESGDMTKVLKQVKIDDLIFDSSRNKISQPLEKARIKEIFCICPEDKVLFEICFNRISSSNSLKTLNSLISSIKTLSVNSIFFP